METQIENYIDYLNSVKHASANTIASYRRDLKKMSRFFADRQCTDVRELRGTDLNSYVLDMESQGMSTATISRSIASMKSFFLSVEAGGNHRRLCGCIEAAKDREEST